MKCINGVFVPCATEVKRARAHARAIERKYPAFSGFHVELWFNKSSGTFHFYELSNGSYMMPNDSFKDCMVYYNHN